MDDIKLFAKHEKELETQIQTIRIYSEDIGMEFNTEKSAMLIMSGRKRQITEGIELTDQEIIKTIGEKEEFQVFTHIGSWHHQTSDDEKM